MSNCRKCGCRCDSGDLIGGVCDDCREEERQMEIRSEWNRKLFSRNISEQPDGQLVLCSK